MDARLLTAGCVDDLVLLEEVGEAAEFAALLDVPCGKAVISKVLGYGIVAGSAAATALSASLRAAARGKPAEGGPARWSGGPASP